MLDDYIGLYTKERLTAWKALFVPGFTATYTNADGSVTTRTLEEFYESQRAGFARAAMTETLHDVRIMRDGRLAQVSAGFDFTSGGSTRRGRLMLSMVEAQGQFRIASLTDTPVATLAGNGTIGGNITLIAESSTGLTNGGVLAPTAASSGTKLSVTGTTSFGTGSIFEWDISATDPATNPGAVANSGSYGQLAGDCSNQRRGRDLQDRSRSWQRIH